MKAVVLAAGRGERLYPFTVKRSKALVPIAGRPLVWYVLAALREAKVDEAILVVSKDSDVKSHIERRKLPFTIEFSIQHKQLGTGDALLAAQDHISKGERFLALNGDLVLAPLTVKRFLQKASGKLAIAVIGVADVSEYGSVVVEGGALKFIREKAEPGRGLANAGIYVFDHGIFTWLERIEPSPRGEFELTDAINALASSGKKILPVRIPRREWCDVGRPWDIIAATKLAMREYNISSRAPGSEIDERAAVRGTYVGAGATIEDARVSNSVIMDGARIAAGSKVSWSVIGERAYVGERVMIRCKLPSHVASIAIRERVVKAGRRLIGAFIGEEAKVSSGVTLPPASFIGPGEVV